MAQKIYYNHIIIKSGYQDDVEREINSYVNESGGINIISLNVIPEKVGIIECDGHALPKYWYHISMVFTAKEE
jgi:hypothetical protein